MIKTKTYDFLIIGGGISASVFASNFLQIYPKAKIAIIEAGRHLGGRASTRRSRKFKDWELNHGSPNFNICNKKNKPLANFINILVKNNFIKSDDSELVKLGDKYKSDSIENLEFSLGQNYVPLRSMSDLTKSIVSLNNSDNQIDFYFQTLIVNLNFNQNLWNLTALNGEKFKSRYLVCSSNLLLHKRSMQILKINHIPLRNAIPRNMNKKIDYLFNFIEQQSHIPRLTFLIYTKPNYIYKDFYLKKYRYFYLMNDLENKFKFERVVFQLQNDNKLGIVIHSKNLDLINEYLNNKNEDIFKSKLIRKFNELFESNPFINQLNGNEDISIMRWRASQPCGKAVPISLQICKKYNIGFCGDWFEEVGFGRIEGAIVSGLRLAESFKKFI